MSPGLISDFPGCTERSEAYTVKEKWGERLWEGPWHTHCLQLQSWGSTHIPHPGSSSRNRFLVPHQGWRQRVPEQGWFGDVGWRADLLLNPKVTQVCIEQLLSGYSGWAFLLSWRNRARFYLGLFIFLQNTSSALSDRRNYYPVTATTSHSARMWTSNFTRMVLLILLNRNLALWFWWHTENLFWSFLCFRWQCIVSFLILAYSPYWKKINLKWSRVKV